MRQYYTSLCSELSDEYPNRRQIFALDWMRTVRGKYSGTCGMEKKSCFPDFRKTVSSSQVFVVLQTL